MGSLKGCSPSQLIATSEHSEEENEDGDLQFDMDGTLQHEMIASVIGDDPSENTKSGLNSRTNSVQTVIVHNHQLSQDSLNQPSHHP